MKTWNIVSWLFAGAIRAAVITEAPTPTATASETETESDVVWTTIIDDPWTCFTETIAQYFDFPEPTGDLQSALLSYGEVIRPTTSCNLYDCLPQGTAWCGFEKAAPSSLLPAYSTFASSAASWYQKQSASIDVLPTECPKAWRQASIGKPMAEYRLNNTIAWAKCYDDKHPHRRDMPDMAGDVLL